MSNISTARAKDRSPNQAADADQGELADLPLTPREGWTTVISLTVMLMIVGIAIDDSLWAGRIGGSSTSQTGFLPICGIFSVMVGVALAKSNRGRYASHLIGSVIGAVFLLNAIASSISIAPSLEGRMHDLNVSVSTFIDEVVVLGRNSYETSIFLLILGALLWGAGQFAAYAVFRRHKPISAILLTGFILLVNVSVTLKDEYFHVIVFVAAALVLVVRLNLLDQAREWRARGMRDVADVSQAFLRNGAAFVLIAIIAATTLAANASSAPLSRAWRDLDDDLLEVGYAINRFLGGVSGSARGPNILFTPNQTIRGVWESSSEVVFTARSSDDEANYWRGATYDSFDGHGWQQLDRQSQIVDTGLEMLERTPERIAGPDSRHEVTVTVLPIDYGGDVIVAPDAPNKADQQTEIVVHGQDGPFVQVKLVAGVQFNAPYTVTSLVRDLSGPRALTGNVLGVAGQNYPVWTDRYLSIRPDSLGEQVSETARGIVSKLPITKRDPYHIAVAIQDYLYKTGGFSYNTDVRNLCQPSERLVDCFLRTKQGYCEYFATAMVMMLRELGIPSRYVLGYLPGREQEDGSLRVDRSAAHAWVEVFFPGHGWVQFDPTPGNQENGQQPTILAAGPELGPPPSARPRETFGRGELECLDRAGLDCESGPAPNPANPQGAAGAQAMGPLVVGGLLVLGLLALAAFAVFKRSSTTQPELAYRGVTRLATRFGYGPRPAQTAYEFAAGLGQLLPVASDDLKLIATAKVEATYGRKSPGEGLLRSLSLAYRRVRFGLLRLVIRKPRLGLRPRSLRPRRPRGWR
ncbi:MAG: transglutaminaseTgpA domain-containing protein [Candidatus Limnocylindrales bacterium]